MWLLLLTLALANEPNAIAEDLGLGQPTVTEVGWRAAIPGGGIAKVFLHDSEAEAQAQFAWQSKTAQSGHWRKAPRDTSYSEVRGNGEGSMLVRQGTTVVYVRDMGDQAQSWIDAILTHTAGESDHAPR